MKTSCQIKGMWNETLMRCVQLNTTSVKHLFFKMRRNSCMVTATEILLITNISVSLSQSFLFFFFFFSELKIYTSANTIDLCSKLGHQNDLTTNGNQSIDASKSHKASTKMSLLMLKYLRVENYEYHQEFFEQEGRTNAKYGQSKKYFQTRHVVTF